MKVVTGVSGTTQTTPAVNVPEGGWLVYGVATRHTPAGIGLSTWSSSTAGETKLAELATNSGAADITMAVFDSGGPMPATTGATRTLTSSISEGTAVVFAVALRPSASAAGAGELVLGLPLF